MNQVSATERDEQAALFEWIDWNANAIPELKLAFAVPNGQYRRGQAMEPGLKAGVPDICIPVPRGRYHGVFIELKVGNNTATKLQAEWLFALSAQGYFTKVCYGFDDARATIEGYLSMGRRAVEVTP